MYRHATNNIQVNKRGLILCEGETEVIYFKGLVTHAQNKRKLSAVGVEIYKPKNHSPKGLVSEAKLQIKKAKKEEIPFDFVWVVFDKDGHNNLANTFSEIEALRGNPKIKAAFSIVCFEYFILLHFEKTTRSFRKCDDIFSEIKNYFPAYKKATDIYKELIDKKCDAITNCKFIQSHVQNDIDRGMKVYDLSYYCNVHELVEYLEAL